MQKIRVAKNAAEQSSYKNSQGKLIRIGAAVFSHSGKLIASSCNQKKTHCLQEYYNSEMPFRRVPYLHAEIAALLKARWILGRDGLKGCTLYVARKRNDGKWGLARPCEACRAAMKDMGIKVVVYTTDEYEGYAIEHLGR